MSEDRLVKITSVESFAEAEQILQILKQNGITAYRILLDIAGADFINIYTITYYFNVNYCSSQWSLVL